MLTCLIWLIVWAIIAVIIVYVIEVLLNLFTPFPPQVSILIRLLAGLIVLLLVLQCLGMVNLGSGFSSNKSLSGPLLR